MFSALLPAKSRQRNPAQNTPARPRTGLRSSQSPALAPTLQSSANPTFQALPRVLPQPWARRENPGNALLCGALGPGTGTTNGAHKSCGPFGREAHSHLGPHGVTVTWGHYSSFPFNHHTAPQRPWEVPPSLNNPRCHFLSAPHSPLPCRFNLACFQAAHHSDTEHCPRTPGERGGREDGRMGGRAGTQAALPARQGAPASRAVRAELLLMQHLGSLPLCLVTQNRKCWKPFCST